MASFSSRARTSRRILAPPKDLLDGSREVRLVELEGGRKSCRPSFESCFLVSRGRGWDGRRVGGSDDVSEDSCDACELEGGKGKRANRVSEGL